MRGQDTRSKDTSFFVVILRHVIQIVQVGLYASFFLVIPFALASDLVDEMVVTGSRIEHREGNMHGTVTIFDRSEIESLQASQMTDILRLVPGVSVTRSGGIGNLSEVRIRGSETRHVLVLVDGVRVNTLSEGAFYFDDMDLYDVERIEVYRGGYSGIWGGEALSGVIKITTRSALGKEPGFTSNLKLEGGNRNHRKMALSLGGQAENKGLSLQLYGRKYDGYDLSQSNGEKDGYKNIAVALKGHIAPMDTVTLRSFFHYQDNGVDYDSYGTPRLIDSDSMSRRHTVRSGISMDIDGTWRQKFMIDGWYSRDNNFQVGRIDRGSLNNRYHFLYQVERGFDSRVFFPIQHRSLVAAEYTYELFRPFSYRFQDVNQRWQNDIFGFSYEHFFTFTPRWNGAFAIHHDDHSKPFEDITSYRLDGSYQIPRVEMRLHTSWGEAGNRPGFTSLYGYFPSRFMGNPNLKTERASSFDIGVEKAFLKKRWITDITYFYSKLRNEYLSVFDFNTRFSTLINNTEHSYRQGMEVSSTIKPWQPLSITASYTYTRATQHNIQLRRQLAESRRPRHSGSFLLNYHRKALNFSVTTTYTGSRFSDNGNTGGLAPHFLVNSKIGYWLTSNIQVYFEMENMLDKEYQETFRYPGPRRHFLFGFQYQNRLPHSR